MTQPQSLLTVGEIARQLNEPIHRIEYIVRSRSITPVNWAGHARVFSASDLTHIQSELSRMDAERNRQFSTRA